VNSAVTVSARELWMIVLQRTLLLRLQQMASSLHGIWTSRDVTNKVACMYLFCTFTICCWYVGDKYCMSLLLLSMLMFDGCLRAQIALSVITHERATVSRSTTASQTCYLLVRRMEVLLSL